GLEGPMHVAAFSPDGKYVVSAEWREQQQGKVRVWEAATGKEHLTIPRAYYVTFSPDGKRLAAPIPVGSTNQRETELRIWDVANATLRLTCRRRPGTVEHVVFSPDGTRLVGELTTGDPKHPDYSLQIWDTSTGDELRNLPGL